jgi:hypothetical protein
MQTSTITTTAAPSYLKIDSFRAPPSQQYPAVFPPSHTTPCLAHTKERLKPLKWQNLTAEGTQRGRQTAFNYKKNPRIDLHQVLAFLKGKVAIQEKVHRYFCSLQEQSSTPTDFIASVLSDDAKPLPRWFCKQYTHFLSRQEGGTDHLLYLAHHENMDPSLRVACSLQLSFLKHSEANKILGKFLLRQDFLGHRHYILKNIRDEKLKDALLVRLIKDQTYTHIFANAFRLSYIQMLMDPRLKTDMAFEFIMTHLHVPSAQLGKAVALIEDENLSEKVLQTIETGVDFRILENTKSARKT